MAIERYTARLLKAVQIRSVHVYICLDAVDISEGYISSSVNSRVNRDASHNLRTTGTHLARYYLVRHVQLEAMQ